VDQGNTVIVVEHNLDVVGNADYIVDLGPEGGDEGGYVIFAGTPEELVKQEHSYTGQYLRLYWNASNHSLFCHISKIMRYTGKAALVTGGSRASALRG